MSSRGPEVEIASSRQASGCSASFPLSQYSKKDRGLRALSRHLPFSPGKYLAQRISFIPWTCLSCWKQLGKGPEKANLAGGGGELQQTGFSTLVDGLNAGCMGPPHPHPQP